MPKPSLPESVLALFAGRARAAAIYGDLLELAPACGRVWFAAEYLRSLISLGWRIPASIFCGSTALIGISLFPFSFRRAPDDGRLGSQVLNLIGPLLLASVVSLWFAVPYWLVRYGVRDRVAKLGLTLLLLSTVAYVLPWSSVAFMAIAGAAIVSVNWRRPMIALAAIIATGSALQAAVAKVFTAITLGGHDLTQDRYLMVLFASETITTVAAAIACSLLRRWLLRPTTPPSAETPVGEANA